MLRRAPSVGPWWAGGGGGEAGACCTESLGSESGDVGCDADEIDQLFFPPAVPAPASAAAGGGGPDAAEADVAALCGAEEEEEASKEEKGRRRAGGCGCFPPAMPRATGALFLRAERRAGRLILTEVRADEHERRVVFRAQRDGGRLRLRFANDEDDVDDDVDVPERGGETEAGGGGGDSAGAGPGGVVPVVAVQVQHGGGAERGRAELCQVAAGAAVAGRRGGVVEVGAVMMGTTI